MQSNLVVTLTGHHRSLGTPAANAITNNVAAGWVSGDILILQTPRSVVDGEQPNTRNPSVLARTMMEYISYVLTKLKAHGERLKRKTSAAVFGAREPSENAETVELGDPSSVRAEPAGESGDARTADADKWPSRATTNIVAENLGRDADDDETTAETRTANDEALDRGDGCVTDDQD